MSASQSITSSGTPEIKPLPPISLPTSSEPSHDPEKLPPVAERHSRQRGSTMARTPRSTTYTTFVGDEDGPEAYEDHLLLILLHLCSTSPLLSLLLATYAIIATIVLILLTPLSLCINRDPSLTGVSTYLGPVLRVQLRLIHSNAHYVNDHRPARLLPLAAACIAGPLVALALMLAAWVVGVFWAFAAIVGDPNDKRGKEDEGRIAVRALRRWWERLLLWGLEP